MGWDPIAGPMGDPIGGPMGDPIGGCMGDPIEDATEEPIGADPIAGDAMGAQLAS